MHKQQLLRRVLRSAAPLIVIVICACSGKPSAPAGAPVHPSAVFGEGSVPEAASVAPEAAAVPAPASRIEPMPARPLPVANKQWTSVLKLRVYEECTEDQEHRCREHGGVHYGAVKADVWGPNAFYVDEQRHFWLLDAPAERVVGFDAGGKLTEQIPYELPVAGVTALAVSSAHAFVVLQPGPELPAVLHVLERSGKLLASVSIPPSTTVMVPDRADVVLSGPLSDGPRVVPRLNADGVFFESLPNPMPFELRCDGAAGRGTLRAGDHWLTLSGCFSPLRVTPRGELDIHRGQGVARFAADGTPLGAASPPPSGYAVYLGWIGPAAGPAGESYAVVPHRKVFEIVRLELPAI